MAKKKGYALGVERRNKREQIMGKKGARMQERRHSKALKGVDAGHASESPKAMKIKGREAIKRVGEYKHAVRQKAKQHKANF